MTAIGIEMISVFGLPPVDFVELAAELGVRLLGAIPLLPAMRQGADDGEPVHLGQQRWSRDVEGRPLADRVGQ